MAKIKNISGDARLVQSRLVLEGADLDVPADEVWSYTCQETNWAPADDEARAVHDAAVAASDPAAEPSIDWTKKQLEGYATEHNVDLDGATTKAEILDRITNSKES